MIESPPFPAQVGLLTRELAAFHEAAHVVIATKVGARVKAVTLIDDPHPHGKSTIETDDDKQSMCIACAGAAAEFHLALKRRFRDSLGREARFEIVLPEIKTNTSDDLERFRLAHSRYVKNGGVVSEETFFAIAHSTISSMLDIPLVESVAGELLAAGGTLDEDQIKRLIETPSRKDAEDVVSRMLPDSEVVKFGSRIS